MLSLIFAFDLFKAFVYIRWNQFLQQKKLGVYCIRAQPIVMNHVIKKPLKKKHIQEGFKYNTESYFSLKV